MADFNPYASQQAAIARQQKMADILQQQAFQPQEAGSYNGIPAALPAWGGLAKALQGYMGGLQSKRAEAGQTALGVQQKADQDRSAAALAAVLNGDPVGPLDPTGMNPDDLRTATALTAQRQAAAAAEQRAQTKLTEQRAYDAQQPQKVNPYTYTYEGNPTMARDDENSPWRNANTPEMDAANKKLAGNYLVEGQQMGTTGPIQTIATSKVIPSAGQTITIGGKAELAGDEEFSKAEGKRAADVLQSGSKANERLIALTRVGSVYDQLTAAGGFTGPLAPIKAQLGALFEGMGHKDWADRLLGDKVVDLTQALDGLSKEMLGGLIGTGPDAIMPANNFSEADRDYLNKIIATTKDTPGAFQIKLMAIQKVAERSQARSERLSELIYDQGMLPTKALAQVDKEFRADPKAPPSAFTPDEQAKIDAAISRSGTPPAAGGTPSPAVPGGATVPTVRKYDVNGRFLP